jgi:hypothetical protein
MSDDLKNRSEQEGFVLICTKNMRFATGPGAKRQELERAVKDVGVMAADMPKHHAGKFQYGLARSVLTPNAYLI